MLESIKGQPDIHIICLSLFIMPGHMSTPLHSESPEVLLTCSVLPLTPVVFFADQWTNPEVPDVILSATQGPPSLIPWPKTRFYPAVKAGRLIST